MEVMKQGTMNILFFVLKTKLLKNGEAPVLMRITINGSYDDARIQRSVPLNLWNAAKGCSKGRDRASIALNTYIAELHARALEKHKELVLEQALITPKLILKRVFGKDTEMRTLLGTMRDGIKKMETLAGLEKYREHPICIKKGCCLPVMCNQKMNSYLKEIADFCGIKKNLTTHVARHTFGTTVTLANNVPLQDVSVMLGHFRDISGSSQPSRDKRKENLTCIRRHPCRANNKGTYGADSCTCLKHVLSNQFPFVPTALRSSPPPVRRG